MKLIKKSGVTSEIWDIFIQDSSSTTGAGLTGITSTSTSLSAYYTLSTSTSSAATSITLSTMTYGTFTSGGLIEVDATNMPGFYQFCPPNAALAATKSAAFLLKGFTNMAPLPIEVQLVSYDPYDSVRLGLTSLPNVTAGSSGGLPTAVDSSGRVAVTSNIKKANSSRLTFVMTDSTTHAPKTGLTVTGQVSLDGAALGSLANSVSEIASGLYTVSLSSADTNANELAYRFTATGADDLVIERVTQP